MGQPPDLESDLLGRILHHCSTHNSHLLWLILSFHVSNLTFHSAASVHNV
jgi:hypothetical protein